MYYYVNFIFDENKMASPVPCMLPIPSIQRVSSVLSVPVISIPVPTSFDTTNVSPVRRLDLSQILATGEVDLGPGLDSPPLGTPLSTSSLHSNIPNSPISEVSIHENSS